MKAKYINPFTDYGFKKIFGEEASKPLLIDFLNALLPEKDKIRDLSFKNTEQLGQTSFDRKSIYDIYCESEAGEKFIVELQKAKQNYFIERTVYYSTFPISEQAEKGEWNYNLKAVYCIGILDFTFEDYEKDEVKRNETVHEIKLKNQHGTVFYDKLTYIYLEMPNFKKTEAELETRLDKWLYFIKNLEDFQSIPQILQNEVVFIQAFEKAEVARFNRTEFNNYEYSLKVFRDLKNTYDYAIETAKVEGLSQGREEGLSQGIEQGREEGLEQGLSQGREEGLEQGIEQGKIEIAKTAKKMGLKTAEIALLTGLSEEEIGRL